MSPSRRIVGILVLSLVVASFIGLMAVGLLNRSPVTGKSGFTRVQKPAPEFTLTLFHGGELDLSQHIGEPMVINFWASWCPPCHEEAPLLERTWRSYKDKNVLFVGVDIQDTEQDGRDYLEEYGITYPNGLDGDGKITVEYGVIGLPVTFFVNRDGVVERRWVGSIEQSRLIEWVEELAAGQGPSDAVEGQNLEDFVRFE